MTITMEQAAGLLGLPVARPVARLIDLHAPVGESECEFWRRKAGERSRRIAELERVVANLRDAIDVLEDERVEREL